MSADGSMVIATGDYTVYAFPISKQSTQPVTTTKKSATPGQSHSVTIIPANDSTQTLIIHEPTTREITAESTEYSVIKTSTQSPLSGLIPLGGLLTAVLVLARRR
jgi:hypothetical protein